MTPKSSPCETTARLIPVPEKEQLLVSFDRPIDAGSLDVSDVGFSGPTTLGVEAVQVISDRSAIITLNGSIAGAGSYTVSIGPNVLGSSGTPMDQDSDGVAGEDPQDVFSGSFVVDTAGPRIVSQSPTGTVTSVLTSIEVTFNEAIDPKSFTPRSVELLNPQQQAARAAFDPSATIDGFHVRSVRSASSFTNLAAAENVASDPSRQTEVVFENTPTINYGPSGGQFGGSAPSPLDRPSFTDDYLVLEATATITIPSAGLWTFAMGSDDGYRLEIDSLSAEFSTGRGFDTDLVTFDFPAAGDFPLRFLMFDLTGNSGFELSAVQGEKTAFDSDFKLVGDTADGGLAVVAPGIPPTDSIRILSVTPTDATHETFRITFPAQPSDGDYELTILPEATDVSGNVMDQDNDGVGGEAVADRYLRTITVARDPLRVVSSRLREPSTVLLKRSMWCSMCRSIPAALRPATRR